MGMLRGLSESGWVFTYPRDRDGHIIAGYAVRLWPGEWWDGLILHAETECEAFRVDPDNTITWRLDGTALDVATALLESNAILARQPGLPLE